MTDITSKIANLPFVQNLAISGVVAAGVWWYWYKLDFGKALTKAFDQTRVQTTNNVKNAFQVVANMSKDPLQTDIQKGPLGTYAKAAYIGMQIDPIQQGINFISNLFKNI
jgi:hypothetical protein